MGFTLLLSTNLAPYKNSITNAFGYDIAVSSVKEFNAPHSGGKSLSIFGRGFSSSDLSLSARIALAETTATIWGSGSVVLCKVPSAFKSFVNSITVSIQKNFAASIPNAYSFDTVSNLDLMQLHSIAVTGSGSVVFTARNVGFRQLSSRLRLGFSACSSSVIFPSHLAYMFYFILFWTVISISNCMHKHVFILLITLCRYGHLILAWRAEYQMA
jgi:hypothetical protein